MVKEKKKKGIIKRLGDRLDKAGKKVVKSKKVLKGKQMTVTIQEHQAPSILGDPNRFFKDEYEHEKRGMFL